jgi:hypothetical protein
MIPRWLSSDCDHFSFRFAPFSPPIVTALRDLDPASKPIAKIITSKL